jgi:3alpha(or 20beta)-hydroxysteroid dehydrogenase
MASVAVVTGANSGIGRATAIHFAAQGYRAIGTVRDRQRATKLGTMAAERGVEVELVELDVADDESVRRGFEQLLAGAGHVDVLVNNAGVLVFQTVHKTTLEEWERVQRVNVTGTFLGIKAVTPSMEAAGGGSIVNISSTAGLVGLPFVAAYVASKWAVRGLTKSAAIDLGHKGIRVNSVHPGGIDTPMVAGTDKEAPFYKRLPVSRMGSPDEVARAALFLASDESSYTTGAELSVDGGATAGDLGLMS